LLRTIDLDHFIAVRACIGARAARYPDLAAVKARIANNLPQPDLAESRAILTDIGRAGSGAEVLRLYLAFVGRKLFDSVFPP
jgi:hypothetical protein